MRFTFDGCGINDAEHPYAQRLATLTDAGQNNPAKIGDLLAAAPTLLAQRDRLAQCLRELAIASERFVFTAKPVGSPNSDAREKQDDLNAAHDRATAALAELEAE